MDFLKVAREMAEEESNRIREEVRMDDARGQKIQEIMTGLTEYLKNHNPTIGRNGKLVKVTIGDSSLGIMVESPEKFEMLAHTGTEKELFHGTYNEQDMMRQVVIWYRETVKKP